MRKHYDFTKAKKNPYARRLKRQITIRLDEPTIAYFKSLAMEPFDGSRQREPTALSATLQYGGAITLPPLS